MNIEQQRAAFEAWASDSGNKPDNLEQFPMGGYKKTFTAVAWSAWQKATELDRQGRGEPVGYLDVSTGGHLNLWTDKRDELLALPIGRYPLHTCPQPAEPVKEVSDGELTEFMWQYADEERSIPPRQYAIAARALLARYGQPAQPVAPTDFWQWLAQAYGSTEAFTKWNMEVAYRAGLDSVAQPASSVELIRTALEQTAEWISGTPHGDNCYLDPNHDLGKNCECGKDSILQHISNVLEDSAPTPPADGQAHQDADKVDAERWRHAVANWHVYKVDVFPGGLLANTRVISWDTLTYQADAARAKGGQS